MDTMRRIATAYYGRASEEEKEQAEEFFRKLDVDGDGKVTRDELKKAVESSLSNEKVFKQLDENGDGTLDFHEVLAVYYMVKKTKILACHGCCELLLGPYFSCFLCVCGSQNSFDLCRDCYGNGSVYHKHSPEHFLDNHQLVEKLKVIHVQDLKSPRKRQMEGLLETAKAHYLAAPKEVQNKPYEFFSSMDTNGDHRVDLCEFLSFMRQQGFAQMRNNRFFDELDQDGNGTLDFYEVMTLYYIIKSGRPFCDGCGEFIPGIYFPCAECFNHRKTPFCLCPKCYRHKSQVHTHEGRAQFLDNYALLETKRVASPSPPLVRADSSKARSPVGPSNNNEIVPVAFPPSNAIIPYGVQQPYYANAPPPLHAENPSMPSTVIVIQQAPCNNNHKWEKWRVTFHALESALGFAGVAGILGCTIM